MEYLKPEELPLITSVNGRNGSTCFRVPAHRYFGRQAQEFIPHLHILDNQKSSLSLSGNIKRTVMGSYDNTVVSNLKRYLVQLRAQRNIGDEM